MKILHIVPSYKPAYIYGGPIESVSKLCEGLVSAGHEVAVFTTTANGEQELDVPVGVPVDIEGVSVTYFKRITKDPTHVSLTLWKKLYQVVKTYDIVNIHSWWNILVIIAACICHWRKVKVVISPRGMLSDYIFQSGSSKFKKLIHFFIGKAALSKCTFHATAQSEYNECKQVIPGWVGFVQPNIISLPDLPISKKENKVFTLIFMSRIHPKKRLEILFDAVSQLNFPVILKIAGSGDDNYIQTLKSKAIELGITNSVVWLGWVDRLAKFNELMSADLFVLVSQNENFANVVIESLHVGTPVLISKEVALSAFVEEVDLGWVTSLETTDVIAKISEAKMDIEKLARIQQDGRDIIEKNFSVKKLISAYIQEYMNVIDDK